MTTRRLFYVLTLIALLAGCTGRPPQPAAPTATPVEVAIVAPTAGPTAAPTAQPTALPTAVPTAAPTATATAAPTVTPTMPPTATAMPTVAPTATATVKPTATRTPSPAPVQGGGPGGTAGGGFGGPAGTPGPTTTAIPADQYPLSIPVERVKAYPGSEITFEQTLPKNILVANANYASYVVSYRSDGLKIYALMTVPDGPKPATGWPVVIFNHGYIPPTQYVTTQRYLAYQDAFARAGYITFKSDYRGHGKSEGRAQASFSSADYTTDVLNALASVKAYKDADPNRIGMWGHSMGGQVTLRAMVISKDIKAGVIWAGTVASTVYEMTHPRHPTPGPSATPVPGATPNPYYNLRGRNVQLIAQYGSPDQNPAFWNSLSPNSYLSDLSGPLQLHHGTADTSVPPIYSSLLFDQVKAAGKTVELYTYPGQDHNININPSNPADLYTALARSVAWMDKYVKGK